MSGPQLARDKRGRRYDWPYGNPPIVGYPSVTTILSQKAKPALVNWAAREVATFAAEHIDQWSELPVTEAIDLLKRAPYRNMTRKADIGTAVHAAIDAWHDGVPTVDLALVPYVAAAVQYLEDKVDEILFSEVTIFNRSYQYAGTCDAIVTLKDGRNAIIDWKSGSGIYPETSLQLVAYAYGDFIANPDTKQEVTLPKIDTAQAIHIPGNGTYTVHETDITPRSFKFFTALRSLQLFEDEYAQDTFKITAMGSTTQEE